MLYHPGLHQSLTDLRDAELARRNARPRLRHGRGHSLPVRHAAASLLRRVADRLDPQPRPGVRRRPMGAGG
jgi:hypothetical protein